jgi:eukaryotic-like serine/threonine-protein kinase
MSMVGTPSAIGRFQVRGRLGAGGFATVWLAHDPELDAPVAVKILADNWSGHAEVRQRFAEEARLLRRVDNDRVVRVYDVGSMPDGRPYLVMTYADGGSLADRMREHPPPWPTGAVLDLVDAVAAGLRALHVHGIVHRDAGPRNILFRQDGSGAGEQVLLGDLGIAKDLRWASGLTQPAGTVGYQAPEQMVVSADVGPATDVHALAVVAAGLLGVAGPPWPATPVGDVFQRATAADPRDRTPVPARFAAEMRHALTEPEPEPTVPVTGSSGRSVPARGIPAGRASPRRRGLIAIVVAAAVLAGIAGVLWAVTGRPARFVSENGRIAVAVPGDWVATPARIPGETGGEGVRLVDGERTVTVAFAPTGAAAAQVATRRAGPACPTVQPQLVEAGDLRGAGFAYSGCAGDAALAVAGLSDPERAGWVIWVEVRSVGGRPTLEDVLSEVSVRPAGSG